MAKKNNAVYQTNVYKDLSSYPVQVKKIIEEVVGDDSTPDIAKVQAMRILLNKLTAKYTENLGEKVGKDVELLAKNYVNRYKNAISVDLSKLSINVRTSRTYQQLFKVSETMYVELSNAYNKDMAKVINQVATLQREGTITRQQALKQVLKENKGPTVLFKDGKNYPAQAYYETVLIEEQKTGVQLIADEIAESIGTDIYVYSTGTNAIEPRESCMALEGSLVAKGWSGQVTDLSGAVHEVLDLYHYGYGDAGGPLGIRCAHDIFPFDPQTMIL